MKDTPNVIGSLLGGVHDYLDIKIDLLKLKAVDKSSEVISSVVSRIVIVLVLSSAIFILNIGISIWLGSIMGQMWYGFFAVGGFYALLTVVLSLLKSKWLKGPLNNLIVNKMFN